MSNTSFVPRYLLPFDTATLERIVTDYVVVGSGNAGLRAAIELAEGGEVLLISKEDPNEGSTRYAQGGIAVALSEEDRPEYHVQDTLAAGAGLCDPEAVRFMVEQGVRRVRELLDWGAQFDREGESLKFGMEGAHRVRRIVHRGDATGEETQNVLVRRAMEDPNVHVLPHTFAVDLLTEDESGRCVGVLVQRPSGELTAILARATVLAAGGLGQLFGHTSNPAVTTGDGMAMAFRAGAVLADMEFVQFHPTALHLPGAPHFLISEALRGEGAILLNVRGERFMIEYDEREELAPRDVVSRAILAELERTQSPVVYLDITHRSRAFLEHRFPTILKKMQEYGLEIWRDTIPVAPVAHFMMGGVWTGVDARTTLPGLYACGEVACTGVHGANRLASNSLLEGLVFGAAAAQSALADSATISRAQLERMRIVVPPEPVEQTNAPRQLRERLAELMWSLVGIVRSEEGLTKALEEIQAMPPLGTPDRAGWEYANLRLLGELIARAALARTESRGAHFRADYPEPDDRRWRRRILLRRSPEGRILLELTPLLEENDADRL
ncbi:MAG: L-aspartate oxidase [Candidatus Poribacteria bacterium]|nr:MAG: L-aspartate oxidase [Candidatus Poribacteria bacterium]